MKNFIYLEAGEGHIFTHKYTFIDEVYNFALYGWMDENAGCDTQDKWLVEWCKKAEIGDYYEHRLGICVRVNRLE